MSSKEVFWCRHCHNEVKNVVERDGDLKKLQYALGEQLSAMDGFEWSLMCFSARSIDSGLKRLNVYDVQLDRKYQIVARIVELNLQSISAPFVNFGTIKEKRNNYFTVRDVVFVALVDGIIISTVKLVEVVIQLIWKIITFVSVKPNISFIYTIPVIPCLLNFP